MTTELEEAGIVDLFDRKGGVRYEKLFHSHAVWDGSMRNFSWQAREGWFDSNKLLIRRGGIRRSTGNS